MSNLMKCALYPKKGGDLEVREVEIPEVRDGFVRVRVMACGVCHTDINSQSSSTGYPRIPGHEAAGVIDKIGKGVEGYKAGDRVGVGFFAGCCHWCSSCSENNWIGCSKRQLCGIHIDGGYAEYMCVPADALARLPDDMPYEQAAPMLCAGLTVFNAMQKQQLKPGSLVCVHGIGGLGHLAIQFAKKLGYEVIAYSSGSDKEPLAKQLGAQHYIDGSKDGAIKQLKEMAPAMLVITGPNTKVIESLIPTVKFGGRVLLLAALSDNISVSATALVMNSIILQGFLTGDSRDMVDTMKFAQNNQVNSMIEIFPLDKAKEAQERMLSGKVRFRSVLVMPSLENSKF